MAKLSPVDAERLDVAQAAVDRLLRGIKSRPLVGAAIARMRLIEQALNYIEMARLNKCPRSR
jgi:hypothetical protein